jgi:hypothetical protein
MNDPVDFALGKLDKCDAEQWLMCFFCMVQICTLRSNT